MWAKLPFSPKDPAKKEYKGKTLGQLARLDSKYWFGIVMNFKAEPFQGRPPSEASVKFGEACAAAREHLKEAAQERQPNSDPMNSQAGEDDSSDIPF